MKSLKPQELTWKHIFEEGKKMGAKIGYMSEEDVANLITTERRKRRDWFKPLANKKD